MSRIGKKPIIIPADVKVEIKGQRVKVAGPLGELWREVRPEIGLKMEKDEISLFPQQNVKRAKAFWGLERALLQNMIIGVSKGYEKKLEIQGLGYKAWLEDDEMLLKVGFTHPVKIKKPEDIKLTVEKNIITVSGIDKTRVGQIAAKIRKVKPPEPYKGKGIRYLAEEVRRKAGKRVEGAGT